MDKSNRHLDLFPDRPVKPAHVPPEKYVDPDPMVEICSRCGSPNLKGVTIEEDDGKKTHVTKCKLCWHEGKPVLVSASEAVKRLTRKDEK